MSGTRTRRPATGGGSPAQAPAARGAASPTTEPAVSNAQQAEEVRVEQGPASALELAMAERGSGPAAGGETEQTDFATAFNTEFARQLHVFGCDAAEAAERGPDVGPGQLGGASGAGLSQAELDELFTPTQQDLLHDFCTISSKPIPDRLFNGDEVGGTSAQQRIVMSGHMLAAGTFVPGSFAQRVHARMCGHWANLVLHYAGVARSASRGIREQFDHSGHLSMSVSDHVDEETGEVTGPDRERNRVEHHGGRMGEDELAQRQAVGEEAHRRADFRMRGLDEAAIDGLQAGDWLWLFNDCGGGGGNHSVIFSRFASDWTESPVGPYRRIVCMSQVATPEGGREETRLVGPMYGHINGGDSGPRVTPVTHVTRVPSSARPLRTAAELSAVLGSGREAERNAAFVARRLRGGGQFDWNALREEIQRRNTELIDELAAGMDGERMTEAQQRAFRGLNAEARQPASAQTIGTLVRLNERLRGLVDNAELMDRGHDVLEEDIERQYRERSEANAPEIAELRGQLEEMDREVEEALEAEHEAEEEVDRLSDRSGVGQAREALQARRAEWRALRRQRRRAEGEELTALNEQIAAKDAECDQARDALMAAIAQVSANRREAREFTRAARQARAVQRRAANRRPQLERRLNRLGGQAGYYTSHSTRGTGDRAAGFNGRGETRLTGEIANLEPTPNWGDYITEEGSG